MSTAASAAQQESQADIDARLEQERIDSGEHFDPDDAAEASASTDAADTPKPAATDISAETLALIAGEDKPATVPHARFNEVNLARKAAEARTHELELELARMNGKAEASTTKDVAKPEVKAPTYDYDAAEDLYAAAILDGDQTKAKQIRADIRKNEQEAADVRAEAVADRRYSANRAEDDAKRTKLEFDIELSKAYEAYPFLNSDNADKNADAIEETMVWTQHFIGKGKTSAQALAAAVAKVGPAHAPKAIEQPAVAAPRVDIQQGLDRAAKIPAKAQGVGVRASTLDVSKMSGKDLKALSAEDEASLAGDIV
jgi:hypothetical protein